MALGGRTTRRSAPLALQCPLARFLRDDMTDPLHRCDPLRLHRRWRVPDGVSLVELLCAVVTAGVLATAGFSAVTAYNRSQRASRVAELLQWEITVARGYAIRSGRPMSLFVDEHVRSVALRDGESTWRKLSLGDGSPLEVERLVLDLPGDSLAFSPRGLCVNCSATRLVGLSVDASGRLATVRIGMLGRPELHGETATPN